MKLIINKKVIDGAEVNSVNARELWERLEVKTPFSMWMQRKLDDSMFIDGQDFITVLLESIGGRPEKSYIITLEMAKHLAMTERNGKGMEVRQYFIDSEKKLRELESEEEDKALAIPMTYLEALEAHIATVKELDQANEVIALQAPKVECYEELLESEGCVNLTYPAKKYGYKNGEFLRFLRHKDWVKKNSRETVSYLPKSVKGWFKDVVSNTGHKNVKVTAEGLVGLKAHMDEYAEFAKAYYKDGLVRL